jgi:tetratricopeptide (TPR) repeat protein
MALPAMLLLATLAAPQEAPPAPAAAPAERPARAARPAATSSGDPLEAGLAAFHRRRFTQARAEFERAVEADPQSAAAHYYLGYTIYKIAEPKRRNDPGKQEAAQHFAKAFELDPAFKPAWGPRG